MNNMNNKFSLLLLTAFVPGLVHPMTRLTGKQKAGLAATFAAAGIVAYKSARNNSATQTSIVNSPATTAAAPSTTDNQVVTTVTPKTTPAPSTTAKPEDRFERYAYVYVERDIKGNLQKIPTAVIYANRIKAALVTGKKLGSLSNTELTEAFDKSNSQTRQEVYTRAAEQLVNSRALYFLRQDFVKKNWLGAKKWGAFRNAEALYEAPVAVINNKEFEENRQKLITLINELASTEVLAAIAGFKMPKMGQTFFNVSGDKTAERVNEYLKLCVDFANLGCPYADTKEINEASKLTAKAQYFYHKHNISMPKGEQDLLTKLAEYNHHNSRFVSHTIGSNRAFRKIENAIIGARLSEREEKRALALQTQEKAAAIKAPALSATQKAFKKAIEDREAQDRVSSSSSSSQPVLRGRALDARIAELADQRTYAPVNPIDAVTREADGTTTVVTGKTYTPAMAFQAVADMSMASRAAATVTVTNSSPKADTQQVKTDIELLDISAQTKSNIQEALTYALKSETSVQAKRDILNKLENRSTYSSDFALAYAKFDSVRVKVQNAINKIKAEIVRAEASASQSTSSSSSSSSKPAPAVEKPVAKTATPAAASGELDVEALLAETDRIAKESIATIEQSQRQIAELQIQAREQREKAEARIAIYRK